jgi:ABC-type nitrate/sulfonate/bicarbonate transport system permease component
MNMTMGSRFRNPVRELGKLVPFLIVILLWELLARSGIYNAKLFPAPTTIAGAFREMIVSRELFRDLFVSIGRALVGFGSGALLGISIGVLTGRNHISRFLLHPVLQSLRSIPSIGLLPLAILFFGLDEMSKYFLVFWGVFFPVWVNSHLGVLGVEQRYIWAARSLGAKEWRLMREVVIPAALPLIIAGMRVGIGLAFLNLVAAEMSGASAGLGYRVSASHLVFRSDKMIAALVALGILGALADGGFRYLAGKFAPWYKYEDIRR